MSEEDEPLETTTPRTRREVDDGLRFSHARETELERQVAELSANLNALTEVLIADATIALEDYEERRALMVERHQKRQKRNPLVVLEPEPDKYQLTVLPDVDCAAKMHVCKARCCKFEVNLSVQDLDERILRWSYDQPYTLAKRVEDKMCVHSGADGACTVYENRPASCRVFDCREDPRIWVDFENNVLADDIENP